MTRRRRVGRGDGGRTPGVRASAELGDASRNDDGSIVVGAGAAGFPAVPRIREVRARYGIAPGEGLTE